MLHRNCCRCSPKLRAHVLSQAARSALAEPLESRVHLSYDNRGKISVIVDGTKASSLAAELAQYQQDLIGDGWTVSLHTNAPRMDDEFNVWRNNVQNPFAIVSTTQQYRDDIDAVKQMVADDKEGLKGTQLVFGASDGERWPRW